MRVFYTLGIYLYYGLVLLASLFNSKAKLWIKGRKGQLKKMQGEIKKDGPIAWFHASSLGEFEQGRPLIEAWKEANPKLKIVLTFFSPSGYEIRKNYSVADHIYYLPLDTRRNARKFLNIVRPDYAIFIKYEFWYHFLKQTRKTGAKLILVSAIFRSNQLFFKSYGGWYRKMLQDFNHIFVQDENSLDLLNGIKQQHVSIAGDTRFDRVAQIAKKSKDIEIAKEFVQKRFTYVFGSTWEGDEELLIRFIQENNRKACYIIAPHEIHPAHIEKLTDSLPNRVALYSQGITSQLQHADVLIIDNIGLLSAIYRYGQVAYIGGGFGKGIHNILEPAVYGMPVVFGLAFEKFREAVELVNEKGAFTVSNYEELFQVFNELEKSKNTLAATVEATKAFIQRNMGATQVILKYLMQS